ncbi:ectoine synthase [Paraburkholderia steynii]|uniref:L-ectoine synthase n=2 Tax=Paraburkholderia steynii TaxID=1245441 RepID=A0A7Z7FJH7_9BURK|nr:ectoine synthase [Paraburkholderia steynii]
MDYDVCHTVVRAGTDSLLQYRNHLEAWYCIAGEREAEDMNGNAILIQPGTIYVPNKHDLHNLRGGNDQDLVLIVVFNPPLKGHERQNLEAAQTFTY